MPPVTGVSFCSGPKSSISSTNSPTSAVRIPPKLTAASPLLRNVWNSHSRTGSLRSSPPTCTHEKLVTRALTVAVPNAAPMTGSHWLCALVLSSVGAWPAGTDAGSNGSVTVTGTANGRQAA